EVESPCHTDYSIKPSTVWLHIHEKAEPAIDGNCQNAVEREKIRRQRDPKVGLVGNDMPTVTAYAKPAHPSAHQPNPKSMGQFVSKDINEDWTRETEKCDQPQNCTQCKKPKFFGCPETLCHRCARESGEKCLTQNCANRQKENCNDEFYPARWHRERIRDRNERPRPGDVAHNFTALGIALSAIVCRSSLSRRHSCRRLRRVSPPKSRRNRGLRGCCG